MDKLIVWKYNQLLICFFLNFLSVCLDFSLSSQACNFVSENFIITSVYGIFLLIFLLSFHQDIRLFNLL